MPPVVDLLVLRGGRVFDPAAGVDGVADVVIERGRITALGPGAGEAPARSERARVLGAEGRWVLPAFVDLHTHLREPGFEYKEDIASGLAAAAAGGYAHVCAMPNTRPVNDTRAVTELMLARASEVDGPSLHPIGAITRGQLGRELTEMGELRRAGCVAVSDDGRCVESSQVMRRALEYADNFGLLLMQHCEDHALTEGAVMHEGAVSARLGLRGWPRVAEDVVVARDLLLAEYLGVRYHVAHVSTRGAVRLLRDAKDRGVRVTAEVTPHHLLLTDEAVLGYRTGCKVNPPLREAEDVAALRAALADGTLDAIATDHAPHSSLEKDVPFAEASPGLVGLEHCFGLLLGLVHRGECTLERFVDALSTAPARLVGLAAPRLAVGQVAELVLVDPGARWVHRELRSRSRNTPFLAHELEGRVLLTLARGREVFRAPTAAG